MCLLEENVSNSGSETSTRPNSAEGENLLGQITGATGLPSEVISKELVSLVAKAGKDADSVTLDELRVILAEYVQDILVTAKTAFEELPQKSAK